MNAPTARYEVFPSKDGHRWRLVAANNEVVAQSEGYGSADAAEHGALDAHATAMAAVTSLTIGNLYSHDTLVKSEVAVVHLDN